MRIKIAEAVALSRRTIPAFALDRWVEIAALERARRELGPKIERDAGVKVTVTDLLLQAMSDTLAGQPAILDRWVEEGGKPQRLSPGSIDIGLVVAVEGGMMIPVLTDLGGRSLAEIARARRDAVQRVRTGRLIAADSAPPPSRSPISAKAASTASRPSSTPARPASSPWAAPTTASSPAAARPPWRGDSI